MAAPAAGLTARPDPCSSLRHVPRRSVDVAGHPIVGEGACAARVYMCLSAACSDTSLLTYVVVFQNTVWGRVLGLSR
eukprot:scaffold1456_cov392-Prasinococcus_capsulatus_cf.AAC.1